MTSMIDAIKDAQSGNVPQNEATTGDWIIRPLLEAAGYDRRDIVSQGLDSSGQFPDYTILPNTQYTWYLEAKAWSIPLQDSHAQQALNYGNQNGRPWVVLSSGKEWRLYDNKIQGLAANKLVAKVKLSDTRSIERFLQAISKESIHGEGLNLYANQSRLASVLDEQLSHADSDVIKAICSALKKQPGLSGLKRPEVVDYFTPSTPSDPPHSNDPPAVAATIPADQTPIPSVGCTQQTINLSMDLSRLRQIATGNKPALLTCPDQQSFQVRNWADVAEEAIRWLADHDKLPSLPFPYPSRSARQAYFLNTTPDNVSTPMDIPRKVSTGNKSIYINRNFVCCDLLEKLATLCRAVSMAPEGFVIQLQGQH